MANIYGQLIKGQLENLASDPGGTPPTGLIWFNTVGTVVKWYDGSAIRTGVDTASSQNLTNKNLASSTNTLTGATAASFTNGGTITMPSGSLTLATLSGTEAFTAKDYQGGTASDTSRLTVPKAALSTLTGLTRKQATLVYDTTGNQLLVDDGTNLNAVGGGSGEKNYVTAPSTASGWTSSDTNGVTVATTTSGLPRANTTKTGILITGVTGTTAYVYYRFILDDADANKKLKIQFDMEPGTAVASDFEVRAYSNTNSDYTTGNTRLALSTDNATPASLLPALTGTYRTTFDAPATSAKYIEIRIKMAASQAHTLVISDVIVGPGVVTQGAAVGPWTSFTPTFNNLTITNNGSYWRRVGDGIEIMVDVSASGDASGTVQWNLQGGLTGVTLDTTRLGTRQVLGAGVFMAGTNHYVINPGYSGSATYATFRVDGTATTLDATNPSGDGGVDSGDRLSFTAMYPVAEWAGAGTVNVVQNDVEYASNSSTADSADTSSFVNGPAGSTFPGTLTADRAKRVRFLTPIQDSDTILIEVRETTGNKWQPHTVCTAGSFAYIFQNTLGYGIYLTRSGITASTDMDVVFARYATSNGATYGAAGSNWATAGLGGNDRWRVRKVNSGQAIGFGELQPGVSAGLVSASGLKGRTDGAAVSTGYVGQVLSTTFGSVNAGTSTTTVNTASLALTAGTWVISASVSMKLPLTSSLTGGSNETVALSATTASLTPIITDGHDKKYHYQVATLVSTGAVPLNITLGEVTLATTGQTVYLNTNTEWTVTAPQYYGAIVAVRIA